MLNSFSSDVDDEKVKSMAEHSADLEIEINASRVDDEIRREYNRDRRDLWLSVYQNNLSNNTGNVLGKTLADKALKDFDDAFEEKEETESVNIVVVTTGDFVVVTGEEPDSGLHIDPSMYSRHAELLKKFSDRGFR